MQDSTTTSHSITIDAEQTSLSGVLRLPPQPRGVIVFPHGTGNPRPPSDEVVSNRLASAGLGSMFLDLLTAQESYLDAHKASFRFDIDLLTRRLLCATGWLSTEPGTSQLPIGLFASGSTSAAALSCAASSDAYFALVLDDGRPDLAEADLPRVVAPTLILVNGADEQLISLIRPRLDLLGAKQRQVFLIPAATDIDEDPIAKAEVAQQACAWYVTHLPGSLMI